MAPQLTLTVFAIAFVVFALAALAQAVTGFGFALVAVPLLALTTEPRLAVVSASLLSLAMVILTAVAERRHIAVTAARPLVLTALIGMPLGLLVLILLPAGALTGIIAMVTLASTALVWRGFQLRAGRWPVRIAGAASGVLLTATGTNGPPLVAALQGMRLEPRQFRATIAAVFAACGVFGMATFAAGGVLTGRVLAIAGVGLPAMVVGRRLGDRIFSRFDAHTFRRMVLLALVLSSAVAMANAVRELMVTGW